MLHSVGVGQIGCRPYGLPPDGELWIFPEVWLFREFSGQPAGLSGSGTAALIGLEIARLQLLVQTMDEEKSSLPVRP